MRAAIRPMPRTSPGTVRPSTARQAGRMNMLRNAKWLSILVVTLFLAGCVISPRRPDPNAGTTTTTTPPVTPPPVTTPPPPPPAPLGKLYVSNTVTPSIVRFDNALAGTTSGNIAPSATMLDTPIYILVYSVNDRLYVADPGNPTTGNPSILIWDSASIRTGNVAPTRNITGAATTLLQPVDMALDSGRNLLYVVEGQDVLVFSSASTSSGNVAPAR